MHLDCIWSMDYPFIIEFKIINHPISFWVVEYFDFIYNLSIIAPQSSHFLPLILIHFIHRLHIELCLIIFKANQLLFIFPLLHTTNDLFFLFQVKYSLDFFPTEKLSLLACLLFNLAYLLCFFYLANLIAISKGFIIYH